MGSGMPPLAFDEFLRKTDFSLESFGFVDLNRIECVVSLREMKEILSVNAMPKSYLRSLLEKIGLVGDFNKKVYKDAKIRFARTDPHSLLLGQKFVYRKNYTAIIENFPNMFENFSMPRGISKLTACIIFGKDSRGNWSLAHYIPPIFEIHNGKIVLMDGVHRNYVVKNSGTTIESIVIEDVKLPFPCSTKGWEDVEVVEIKPTDIKERYFDLKQDLFRDLKAIGIDG